MEYPRTTYGELTSSPWTKSSNETWNMVNETGQTLYWEWNPCITNFGPEDFLVFVRSVLPSGGFVCQTQSNHALIWSITEDDRFAVGIRKLSSTWVVAILEKPEAYPGASITPDPDLSLKAVRFIAEEFLRNTNAIDIYKCERSIVAEGRFWWDYLEKLERIVGWKYTEVKIFKAKIAAGGTNDAKVRAELKDDACSKTETAARGYMRTTHSRQNWASDENNHDERYRRTWESKSDLYERSQSTRTRSRSPSKGLSLPHKSNEATRECRACGITFEHSYELMRHMGSEEHQASLSKGFIV